MPSNKHRFTVRFTQAELVEVDAKRGRTPVAKFCAEAALGRLLPQSKKHPPRKEPSPSTRVKLRWTGQLASIRESSESSVNEVLRRGGVPLDVALALLATFAAIEAQLHELAFAINRDADGKD